MTQGSKGDARERELEPEKEDADRALDEGADPAADAGLFAALRSLGDARPGAEIDDATMLARVLAGAMDDGARSKEAAPVISIAATEGLRPRKRPALRRSVATAFAGLAIAATVAYAAQRIFSASAPPEPPPAPPETTSAPVQHRAPGPRPTPAPSDTTTATEEAPPEPTTSASAEPAPPPATPEKAPPPSADELLKRAQTLYTAGDTAGATAAYRNLIARYPGSGEARAALISLGQLALRAGRAGEALGHFDRYLAGGGPLSIEARVGRIAALRSLGRTADERAAIEDFLARHGDGVHATRLRARLAEISGP